MNKWLLLSLTLLIACRPSEKKIDQWAQAGEDAKLLDLFHEELVAETPRDTLVHTILHAMVAHQRTMALQELLDRAEKEVLATGGKLDASNPVLAWYRAFLSDPQVAKAAGIAIPLACDLLLDERKIAIGDTTTLRIAFRSLRTTLGTDSVQTHIRKEVAKRYPDASKDYASILVASQRLGLADSLLNISLARPLNSLLKPIPPLIQSQMRLRSLVDSLATVGKGLKDKLANSNLAQGNPREVRMFLNDRFDGKENMWQVGTPYEVLGILSTHQTEFTTKGWFTMPVRNLPDIQVKQNGTGKYVPHLEELSAVEWSDYQLAQILLMANSEEQERQWQALAGVSDSLNVRYTGINAFLQNGFPGHR